MQGADHDCTAEARQTLLPAFALLSWIQNTSFMCSRRVEKRAAWCTDPLASSDYYIRTLVRDSIREKRLPSGSGLLRRRFLRFELLIGVASDAYKSKST